MPTRLVLTGHSVFWLVSLAGGYGRSFSSKERLSFMVTAATPFFAAWDVAIFLHHLYSLQG